MRRTCASRNGRVDIEVIEPNRTITLNRPSSFARWLSWRGRPGHHRRRAQTRPSASPASSRRAGTATKSPLLSGSNPAAVFALVIERGWPKRAVVSPRSKPRRAAFFPLGQQLPAARLIDLRVTSPGPTPISNCRGRRERRPTAVLSSASSPPLCRAICSSSRGRFDGSRLGRRPSRSASSPAAGREQAAGALESSAPDRPLDNHISARPIRCQARQCRWRARASFGAMENWGRSSASDNICRRPRITTERVRSRSSSPAHEIAYVDKWFGDLVPMACGAICGSRRLRSWMATRHGGAPPDWEPLLAA